MSRVLFNGKVLREPRSASQLQVGIPPTVNPEATNRVAVIGPSNGGLPVADGKVYTFNSYIDAANVLREGEALRAIGMIFNPSPSLPGAAQVDFIRMDQATAGLATVSDGTGTALTLTSVDKGEWINRILYTVVTQGGGRILTFKIPDVSIQKGADGTVAGAVFTSPTALFKTKGARVGDYMYLSGSTTGLQIFVIQSVDSESQVTLTTTPTAGGAQTWHHFTYSRTISTDVLNSNVDIAAWIAANIPDIMVATVGTSVLPAATTGNGKNFINGTVIAGTMTEITNALVLCRTLNVQHVYIAKACGVESSIGELDFAGVLRGHLINDAQVPALGYIGAGPGKTATTVTTGAIAYAGTLNSARLVYCYQTILETTIDGLSTEQLGGYYLAAKVCGLAAGLPPQTPLTRKPISVRGTVLPVTETVFDRPFRESLLKAGICHVFAQPGTTSFVVNQGLTTLQKNDILWDSTSDSSSEISLMRLTDSLMYNMRVSADSAFIGGNSSIGKAAVENFARSYLESQVGILITDWRELVVTQVADQWQVTFGVIPSNPINYVLLTGVIIG